MKTSVSWLGTSFNPWGEQHHGEVKPGVDSKARVTIADSAAATILIVDDNTRMRQSVRDLLLAYGHNCLLAAGEEAFELLSQHNVDLMLLDLNMPGMDGYQVMQQVGEHFPNLDIIVLSGETTFESATEVLRLGAQDFLRKPYVPDELLRVLGNVLHKRCLEHNIREVQLRLKASEQRYRFIVDNSPDIIYMLDEKGCFVFINERVSSLLGYDLYEVLGRHYSEFVFKEDIDKARFAFDERRVGRRASTNVELRLVAKDPSLPYRHFESHSIDIELTAMGVYSSQSGNQAGHFVGTYGVARDISERKRAEEIINFQLYHDPLTKLPNRALFQDRLKLALSQARRRTSTLAVMYLDMDRFKIINDSLGHLAGDQLLQMVASRLLACLRDCDTLARVGGDEFNLLVTDVEGRKDAAMIAEKIMRKFRDPVVLEGYEVFVSFSIGVALYPEDGQSMDILIKSADRAMYHVKGRGKNGYEFVSDNMIGVHQQPLSLENGIRRALEEKQFELFFQPQFDVCDDRVCGMEALVRWHHPEQGLVMPDEFVPLSEETGLILDLGCWVLDAACQELRRWIDRGLTGVVMAVNISAAQLEQPDFEQKIVAALERHGVPGGLLELEITENVLMQDMDQAVSKLQRLSAWGVRIAVDDFGIGYSSLGYLQALPLNTLKIDRSFISEIQAPEDRNSIITAVFAMSRELNLEVVAEGVENDSQLAFLRMLGCSKAQGFLLGRPATAENARQLLQQRLA